MSGRDIAPPIADDERGAQIDPAITRGVQNEAGHRFATTAVILVVMPADPKIGKVE
jgi:hypothetical protein